MNPPGGIAISRRNCYTIPGKSIGNYYAKGALSYGYISFQRVL